jgi:hypothetical protein
MVFFFLPSGCPPQRLYTRDIYVGNAVPGGEARYCAAGKRLWQGSNQHGDYAEAG